MRWAAGCTLRFSSTFLAQDLVVVQMALGGAVALFLGKIGIVVHFSVHRW